MFIANDMSWTGPGNASDTSPMPAPAPGAPNATAPYLRLHWRRGDDGARSPVNAASAYLDGSSVYGGDAGAAGALRERAGGRMRLENGTLPPRRPGGAFPATWWHVGDYRNMITPPVMALHVVMLLEHNRRAAELAAAAPAMTDDEL
jgi:hypothetical protein